MCADPCRGGDWCWRRAAGRANVPAAGRALIGTTEHERPGVFATTPLSGHFPCGSYENPSEPTVGALLLSRPVVGGRTACGARCVLVWSASTRSSPVSQAVAAGRSSAPMLSLAEPRDAGGVECLGVSTLLVRGASLSCPTASPLPAHKRSVAAMPLLLAVR